MGTFDKYADTPGQIKKEGQEITVRFQRTGPTTGRITWNIPAPFAGCGPDAVQAYDGIVITVNSKPSNYLSNSPVDGKYYTADATGDADLHAGDVLDGALVVGAFYHDKTTTSIEINDILPKTPYYVSAYAVDAVGRYHREGVHAYSLPTGSEEGGMPDKAAKHDIVIDVIGGVIAATPTGLVPDTEYDFKVLIDGKEYAIKVNGENATNFGDLVSELKEKLAVLGDVFVSPLAPFTNQLYLNLTTGELKQWNGVAYDTIPVLLHSDDPTSQDINALWLEPTTKLLKSMVNDVWTVTPYIAVPHNPAMLACDQAWFDGTNVWLYKLTHWEKLHTYIQERNPLLGSVLTCDDYWYNPTTGIVSVWDVDSKRWVAINAIYSPTDPNVLGVGDFWYDETALKVRQRDATSWNVVVSTTYVETLPVDAADYSEAAAGNEFIFSLDSQQLFRRVADAWVEQAIVAFPTDPLNRDVGKYWWNSSTGVDSLFAWDAINLAWVAVNSFAQSAGDPALPVPVVENSAWYNPVTKEVKLVFKTSCKIIFPIIFTGTPGNLPVGTVWHDTDADKWYRWDGTVFSEVEPLIYPTDPYTVVVGYYWYDRTNNLLKRWTGTTWLEVEFVTKPVVVEVGKLWFNSVSDQLYAWDGKAWVESIGLASVELIPPQTSKHRSVLSFFTRGLGCGAKIEVVNESTLLLALLSTPIIMTDPVSGQTGLAAGALYQQLGIGDDGSPDERRAVHDFVRTSLGHPAVKVELTKEQLDICVNLALEELRKFSSYSYRRGVFFLDLMPNQQTYVMTNKCVGFNKVVGVNSIHRHRGLAMGAGAAGNDAFTYAAIQRLYTMGTFDMLSYHLVSAYMEELETLFAQRIMFTWKELERELSVYTKVWKKERVLVDGFFERTEQDLMIDRQTGLWLKRWALAEAKKILSQTRGKFQTLPGPNGSTTLNAQELQTQAEDEMTKLREQLEDYSMQDLAAVGLRAHFIMG